MLACYGHMAIAFKAGVMPKPEGCNANQSAADVNTHSLHCPYSNSCLCNPAAEMLYSSAQWAKLLTRLTSQYLQTEKQSASPPYLAA